LAGNLWLKGAGDPTFGVAAIEKLADAVKASGIKKVTGSVLGDEGLFDRLRGTPIFGGDYNSEIGGGLSALAFDHGDTAKAAAASMTLALRHRGVSVPKGHVGIGTAPQLAVTTATWQSPSIATLIRLTNKPSDNFYAEMLLKLIGAIRTGVGTTKAGLRIERARLTKLGVNPVLNDGSGLSHGNKVRATDVVGLLAAMSTNRWFTASLAVAGRSGTLSDRMRRGAAAGRCSGKTGTLNGVTALAGYCPVKNGGKLAFAILMVGTSSYKGRSRQDRIVQALASWARPASWQR
jgi:D-alanyl-D-alanine carboxypeptidase/D-alanyl-D-alanine-endopeptidase (penicillin-binding protein 4)